MPRKQQQLLLFVVLLCLIGTALLTEAFLPPSQNHRHHLPVSVSRRRQQQQQRCDHRSANNNNYRRHSLRMTKCHNIQEEEDARDKDESESIISRRRSISLLLSSTVVSLTTFMPNPALAKNKPNVSPEQAFAAVRRELYDQSGSVARLQAAADEENFGQLMEMTKTMDQSLRKAVLGVAKKFVADGDQGTSICNAVTFDLIGINRSSRPGQENSQMAKKYIQELRDDMEKMLALDPNNNNVGAVAAAQ